MKSFSTNYKRRRDEVIVEWKNLHNEKLNYVYSSHNIFRVIKSRRMRWAGHVGRMGVKSGLYRILVEKPDGKRPLGRPRLRLEDNSKKICGIYCYSNRRKWAELIPHTEIWLNNTVASATLYTLVELFFVADGNN